jgi:hypothetical protein
MYVAASDDEQLLILTKFVEEWILEELLQVLNCVTLDLLTELLLTISLELVYTLEKSSRAALLCKRGSK